MIYFHQPYWLVLWFFSVNEATGEEREDNVDSLICTERSGLVGDRRSSIFPSPIKRSIKNTYQVSDQGYQIQNEENRVFSISFLWGLTAQIFLSSTNTDARDTATSLSSLQGNTSTQNTMEPNNAASQAMNNVRQYPNTAKNKEETLNSDGSSEYQTPRMFAKNSKLHSYLARKSPNVVRLEKHCYTLYEVCFVGFLKWKII